jgi:copper chaperone CopZ
MMLEGIEDEVPGVKRVEANLKRLEVTVTFDETKVEEQAIIEAARKEGYELIKELNI